MTHLHQPNQVPKPTKPIQLSLFNHYPTALCFVTSFLFGRHTVICDY